LAEPNSQAYFGTIVSEVEKSLLLPSNYFADLKKKKMKFAATFIFSLLLFFAAKVILIIL
jgi:hypothetical protein